jgi:Flp pilus assembly pilin Flp
LTPRRQFVLHVPANPVQQVLTRFHRDEDGQTATEYSGVLVIAVALAFAVGVFVLSPVIVDVGSDIEAYILTVFE